MFKSYIEKRLQKYVKSYFAKHPDVKLIVVVGSVGKTSTKIAIADVLSQRYKIRLHEAATASHLSVSLSILGVEYPGEPEGLLAWLSILRAAKQRIAMPDDVGVIIQELEANRPGEIADYGRYLNPDLAVITAVTPEHMKSFGSIDAVAQEELQVAQFSKFTVINRDDIESRFAAYLTNPNLTTYGTSGAAEYRYIDEDFAIGTGHHGKIITPQLPDGFPISAQVLGEHNLRPVIAAAAVASILGLTTDEIATGVAIVRPVFGRMNLLRGVEDSTLIDDSYSSSPITASSALQTLYRLEAPQKIAVLGDMNDLGETSEIEHVALGRICDPAILSWVITIGEETEKYLAPAARARGCQVKSFKSALDAGAFTHKVIEQGAMVLFKGSADGIYCEEALKVVLHSTEEETMLVRQQPEAIQYKNAHFSKFA